MKLPRTSRGKRGWLLVAGVLAVVGILVCQIRPNPRAVFSGDTAPSFSLLAARGGRCALTDLLAKKRVVLLSFIDARSLPLSSAYSDPSRGQLVFLKSMARQYAPKGVEVLIVGCNGPCGGQPLAPSALLNFTYDWQLDGLTVLRDDATTALRYGVRTLPTTLLVAPDGRIQRRWDGFVAPARLALALESLVGPPPFRQ
jgi:NAD(P)-dependent dehydrogenase (short-subunit alcohol dehydrogenase family)